jgi:intracellular sulfur oxidation DsrE/DsrF family protein
MGKSKGPPADVRADQEVFHFLLKNHKAIHRTVKKLDNGVDTLTESDTPEVATKIQEHVAAMHERVKKGRGLRFWDELFVAIFKNHDKIRMTVENTKKGVRVTETSDDPHTVWLIQLHAEVVSRFVEFGFEESHKNHPVPKGSGAAGSAKLVFPVIKGVGGVVPLPKAEDQPRKGARLVLDLTGESEPGEVHKGLKRAALVLNLYGAAGLKPSDVRIAVVFHGKATRCCLQDAAYAKRTKSERNPNLPVLAALQKAGVQVAVCGQALNYSGIEADEVDKHIPITLAAVLFLTNRHAEGFTPIPVP